MATTSGDAVRSTTRAPTRGTVAAAAAGGVFTFLVVGLRAPLAYRSTSGRLVLETAIAMISAFVALLGYGRFRRRHDLQDLLIVYAMTLLAIAAFFLVTLPLVVGARATSPLVTWAPLVTRLAASLVLAGASLVPQRRVVEGARPGRDVLMVTIALAVLAGAVEVLGLWLPSVVTSLPPPEASSRPHLRVHGVVLVSQVIGLACYATAAVRFTRQARRGGDEMTGWVGAGCAVGVWAGINYLLFPSLYSDWLYTGDFLRLGFYALLLVGAIREIRAYWSAQSEAAVLSERRRLAREIHDGPVQELGYIRNLASTRRYDDRTAASIRSASIRALDEARRAIDALTAPLDEAAGAALARAVLEVGDRHGADVTFEDELGGADLDPDVREALIRIAREAVSNAARHAAPTRIEVTLGRRRLVVRDDGKGFDPDCVPEGRFGLVSMRDRAAGINGRISLDSAAGAGTTVTVTW